ncbi:MAG: pitrilysin family protein [Candidatus Eisenbacteria bacterium]
MRTFTRVGIVSAAATLVAVPCLLPGVPALPGTALAADGKLPKGVEHVVSLEGIHEYKLANGLEVVLWPDPSKAQTTVNITYLVGSMHEGYGETGMAHLLEHMLFKGSTNHTNIPDELTAHGARPNGSTWFDRTNYFETFSATDENLEWALDLEADRMVNSFIRREDLDSEMSVVRNEFEIGENNPQAILEERVYSTAFLWHNYGNSTIGARSDIENVPIPNLRKFYETWYRPENAVLVVAGKFDQDKTLGLIAEKFGKIANPSTPMPPVYTREPAQDGERRVSLKRVGEVQAVAVAYHMPSGAHPDFPAFEVLAHVLGSEPSGRLHKSLVEAGKATNVDGRADRFKDPALFFLSAEVPKDKDLQVVEDELISSAESIANNPPTEEEVQRAVNALMRRFDQAQRNTSWAAVGLSEWAAMGDWRLAFLYRDRLAEVKPADVVRVADTYLRPSNRTVGEFHPTEMAERIEVAETPNIEEMLAEYKGGEGSRWARTSIRLPPTSRAASNEPSWPTEWKPSSFRRRRGARR